MLITSHKQLILFGCGIVLLGGTAVALWMHFDVSSRFVQLLNCLEGTGLWGPAIFTGIYALIVVLVLPGVVFTMGAGCLFGMAVGSLCIIIGTMIGATAAFLLSRAGFRSRAELLIKKHPKLMTISDCAPREALKVVILVRLIPFFPFKASNYLFGVTGIRCREFFLGTLIGIVPLTLTSVYTGALAGDLASVGILKMDRTPFEWTVYGLGLVALLAFAFMVGRDAHRRLMSISTSRVTKHNAQ